ncbi:hypothetical protein GX48_01069 [Paracoccidioides brasiliensis]|nr:hypothetical protein GX48_01069 [Paracoccidioides brasiliensis]
MRVFSNIKGKHRVSDWINRCSWKSLFRGKGYERLRSPEPEYYKSAYSSDVYIKSAEFSTVSTTSLVLPQRESISSKLKRFCRALVRLDRSKGHKVYTLCKPQNRQISRRVSRPRRRAYRFPSLHIARKLRRRISINQPSGAIFPPPAFPKSTAKGMNSAKPSSLHPARLLGNGCRATTASPKHSIPTTHAGCSAVSTVNAGPTDLHQLTRSSKRSTQPQSSPPYGQRIGCVCHIKFDTMGATSSSSKWQSDKQCRTAAWIDGLSEELPPLRRVGGSENLHALCNQHHTNNV